MLLIIIEIIVGLAVLALMGGLIYYFLLRIEVHEQQKVVIERLGKYHRVLEPGWRIKWPLIERKKRFREEEGRMTDYIDLRERTADLAKQQVITKDKIELTVDSVVYYQISDAYKAVYAQKDVLGAIHQKIKTELRNVIGNIDLEQLIRGQQEINDQLQAKLQASANDWGLTLRSIELQSITPPESYKRVSEAELEVQKARLEVQQAELAKQAAIERAQGLKQASILEAEGEAEKINQIYSAIHAGNPNDELLKIKYLEALEKIAAGQATKIFMPFPANPTGDNFFQQAFGMAAGIDAYRAPAEPAPPPPPKSVQPAVKPPSQNQTTPIVQSSDPNKKIIRRVVVKRPTPPPDANKK